MKKVISIILAVILTISMLGVTAFAETLKGDVNGDGNITAVDARMILQAVAGLETVDNTTLYDVDSNGSVSAIDARIILQIVAGLREHPEVSNVNEENLKRFVAAFNGIKTDASAVTLVSTTTYKCQETSINPALSWLFTKEDIEGSLADSYGTKDVNETYTGEDIALAFPPTGTTCTLTMDDIKSIKVEEGPKYYSCTIVVKGETNPTRGKGVGAVATIVTQEDLQSELDQEEELKGLITMDVTYADVTVKADIDKETGKIVAYSADSPLIMSTNMGGSFAFSVGIGVVENWSIAY
jgi:hypothetical protein